MSRELREVKVSYVLKKPEHMPEWLREYCLRTDEDEQDWAAEGLETAIENAVKRWYSGDGRQYVTHEPIVS